MKKLYQFIIALFLLLFIVIIFGTIFDNKALLTVVSIKWNLIGFILSIFLLFGIYVFIDSRKIKNYKMWIFLLFLVLLALQSIFLYFMQTNPGWDWKIVLEEAQNIVFEPKKFLNLSYFENFPNNKWLLLLEVVMYNISKVLKIKSLLFPTYILNIILVDITVLLTVLTAKRLFDEKRSIFVFIMIILSSSFYFYLPILYTDTLSMPIPIMLLYCYVLYKDSKKSKYLWFMGIVGAIGLKFKVTTLIMLIAIIIDYFIENKFKSAFNMFFKIITVFIISVFLLNSIEKVTFLNKLNKDNAIPFTHWIMMGLYEYPSFIENKNFIGAYSLEAYQYTYSFNTANERKTANIKMIQKKLKEYGPINYIKFLYRKMIFVWDDGTFYGANFLTENPIKKNNIIQDFCLTSGKYFYLTFSFLTGILLTYYLSFIVVGIKYLKDKKNKVNVLMLAILGVLLFFLLWEASSKYLFNFVPIFIILAVYGIMIIMRFIRSIYEKRKYIICCNSMLQRRGMFKRNDKKIKRET